MADKKVGLFPAMKSEEKLKTIAEFQVKAEELRDQIDQYVFETPDEASWKGLFTDAFEFFRDLSTADEDVLLAGWRYVGGGDQS